MPVMLAEAIPVKLILATVLPVIGQDVLAARNASTQIRAFVHRCRWYRNWGPSGRDRWLRNRQVNLFEECYKRAAS